MQMIYALACILLQLPLWCLFYQTCRCYDINSCTAQQLLFARLKGKATAPHYL